MKWKKIGRIFQPQGDHEWMATHACLPLPDKLADDVVRIYFSTRSRENQSVISFIEIDADDPSRVLHVHHAPVLGMGKLGAFDDGGVVPFSLVNREGKKYLYYGGYNASVTVPYRNAIGLAVSEDGGVSFHRVYEGAIVDRSRDEPYFTGAADVMFCDGRWRMWYGSATGWVMVDGKPESRYQIKYAESDDGIRWVRENIACIEYETEGEANARPCVLRENGSYRMWYCFRGSVGYRTDKAQSYRLGYAESPDGIRWTRKDREVGIDRSEEGWDSVMQCYPYLYRHQGRTFLLYNGNGFGESGIGCAVLETE